MAWAIFWLVVCCAAGFVAVRREASCSKVAGVMFAGESIALTVVYAVSNFSTYEMVGTVLDSVIAMMLFGMWAMCRRSMWAILLAGLYVIQLTPHMAYAMGTPSHFRQVQLAWFLNAILPLQAIVLVAHRHIDDALLVVGEALYGFGRDVARAARDLFRGPRVRSRRSVRAHGR